MGRLEDIERRHRHHEQAHGSTWWIRDEEAPPAAPFALPSQRGRHSARWKLIVIALVVMVFGAIAVWLQWAEG